MKSFPIIQQKSNPIGLDLFLLHINQGLSALTYTDKQNNEKNWFSNLFGLSEKNPKDDVPVIQYNDKNFFSVQPDQDFKSIAFYYENNARASTDELNGYEADLSLVVWFNRNKYDVDFNVKEHFINAVLNYFANNRQTIEVNSIFANKADVFSNYTITAFQPLDIPFGGFRITFNGTYSIC